MSVRFDLTAIAPELMDAVICMDNSPAYEAFKNEIEGILADFNENSHFGSSLTFDEKALTENSVETLKNMQQAFLLWTINDELKGKKDTETGYTAYLKLFFKANCDKLASLNGGSTTVNASEIADLKNRFIAEINNDPSLYNAVKDFYAGYIYGYSLNYLEEQTIMLKYAEFLVCMGIMTGKIASSVSAQQKIMPKMASLLGNDRFKYISGFIPMNVMLDIIYDRFEFANLSDDEMAEIREIIKNYVLNNYEVQTDDEATQLVAASATATFMTGINSHYVNVPAYSEDIFNGCFGGTRIFMKGDSEDFGEFDTAQISSIISGNCEAHFNGYYTSEREPNLDVSLGSGVQGYKYPLIFRDAENYWYSPIYQKLIDELLESKIYAIIDPSNLPLAEFPFADKLLKTNALRELSGSTVEQYSIRADKKGILNDLSGIYVDTSLSDSERKMLMLELILAVVSGNCSAEKFNATVEENVFNSSLYDEYVLYCVNKIVAAGSGSIEAKRKLLTQLGSLS